MRLVSNHRQLVNLATVFAILGMELAMVSCADSPPQKKAEDAVPKRDITTVMDAHVKELMATPGVPGVAIGALDDGTPCILVLVLEKTPEPERSIPKTIEGHPVQIFESGEIKPMDGQ